MSAPGSRRAVTITPLEWRAVAIVALLVIVLTTAPYVLAWARQGSDWRFGGFVYGVGFRGGHAVRPGRKPIGELLGLTLPGYVIALLASAYVLWTFGRLEGLHFAAMRRDSPLTDALNAAASTSGVDVYRCREWARAKFVNRGPQTVDDLLEHCSKSRRKSLRRGNRANPAVTRQRLERRRAQLVERMHRRNAAAKQTRS